MAPTCLSVLLYITSQLTLLRYDVSTIEIVASFTPDLSHLDLVCIPLHLHMLIDYIKFPNRPVIDWGGAAGDRDIGDLPFLGE